MILLAAIARALGLIALIGSSRGGRSWGSRQARTSGISLTACVVQIVVVCSLNHRCTRSHSVRWRSLRDTRQGQTERIWMVTFPYDVLTLAGVTGLCTGVLDAGVDGV